MRQDFENVVGILVWQPFFRARLCFVQLFGYIIHEYFFAYFFAYFSFYCFQAFFGKYFRQAVFAEMFFAKLFFARYCTTGCFSPVYFPPIDFPLGCVSSSLSIFLRRCNSSRKGRAGFPKNTFPSPLSECLTVDPFISWTPWCNVTPGQNEHCPPMPTLSSNTTFCPTTKPAPVVTYFPMRVEPDSPARDESME